jgi:high affinity sulfate transporter 1
VVESQGAPAAPSTGGSPRLDVVAGLITAAVVIPKAMAYATVAGLPVQVGLYTTLVPMAVYALLGSSRVLSVSTTTTVAILTGASLSQFASSGDSAALSKTLATLTLLVGLILAAAWILRLGFVANFISEPVLVGFKAGIGVVIVAEQIPKLLGFHVPKGSFFQKLVSIFQNLPQSNAATIAVSLATLAALVAFERLGPKIPAPLVAVAGGIAASALLGLAARGVEEVGHIPRGLPPITLPDPSLAAALWSGAAGIALMSFTETIAAGRAFAPAGAPAPRANRELFATGAGNAAAALLGAMPAGGGTSQTAVNVQAGARSQLAQLVTAAVTLATMLLLAPVIGRMPQATLAAVVVIYSIGLIRPVEFRSILSVRVTEFVWAVAAFAGVIAFGTLKGILVAIVLSLFALAHQTADPPLYVVVRKRGTNVFRPASPEHPDDESFLGLLILRPEGRIFFANAERVGEKMRALVEESKPSVVAIDMSGVFDLEYTALKMLVEAEKHLRASGTRVWLVALPPEVLGMVRRSPLGRTLGRERMHFNLEMAVANYLEREGAGAPAGA